MPATEATTKSTPDISTIEMTKLRTIPKIAPLCGIRKSQLYVWVGECRLRVKKLGRGSKSQMRTTLAWVQEAIAAVDLAGYQTKKARAGSCIATSVHSNGMALMTRSVCRV